MECWSPWINVLASLGMAMAVLLAVTFIVAKRVNKHSRRSTSKGVLRIFIIFLQTSYTVVSCMLHLLCVAVIWLLHGAHLTWVVCMSRRAAAASHSVPAPLGDL